MPTMALTGVRISWLMVARKSDLNCVACSATRFSASSFLSRSWFSNRMRSDSFKPLSIWLDRRVSIRPVPAIAVATATPVKPCDPQKVAIKVRLIQAPVTKVVGWVDAFTIAAPRYSICTTVAKVAISSLVPHPSHHTIEPTANWLKMVIHQSLFKWPDNCAILLVSSWSSTAWLIRPLISASNMIGTSRHSRRHSGTLCHMAIRMIVLASQMTRLACTDWVARMRKDSRTTACDSSDVSVMSNILEGVRQVMV